MILFVELALIRWTSAFVVYLSYFTNFVLLGSFFGIGLGFLRPAPRLFRFAPLALAGLVGVVYAFPTRLSHPVGSGVIYFGAAQHTGGMPVWVALPVVFVAVAFALMLLAGAAAAAFSELRPLTAYRYDLLGSICGVGAFALISEFSAPPWVWGLVIVAVLAAVSRGRLGGWQALGVAGLMVPLAFGSAGITWSPYYAIQTVRDGPPHSYAILVNGVPHQRIESISERLRGGGPSTNYYFIPYERIRHNPLRNVLVVGAGSGTDVAVALRRGAGHVDAVEIDPELLALGRRLNPDRPYASRRVSVHIEDGRAFLERSRLRYDLIVFALPDSLTLIAGQSSLRLESYLFTLEALRSVRSHLNPDGAFAMYNFYRRQWLVDRFAATIQEAFGRRPCVDEQFGRGSLGPMANLAVGVAAGNVACKTVWRPHGAVPSPATDDHPFPYLRSPSLPRFYLLALALIVAAAILGTRATAGHIRSMRPYTDLFLMGAAFFLLETKSVVTFALLFGTTWIVNVFVFLGVLVAVLAAVEVAARIRLRRQWIVYTLLLGSLALAWSIPNRELLQLDFAARLPAAIALTFAPVFFANLVFARRFRDIEASTVAFGANLLGAMIGGTLEYQALVVGYRALIVAVGVLYLLAIAAGSPTIRAAPRALLSRARA